MVGWFIVGSLEFKHDNFSLETEPKERQCRQRNVFKKYSFRCKFNYWDHY